MLSEEDRAEIGRVCNLSVEDLELSRSLGVALAMAYDRGCESLAVRFESEGKTGEAEVCRSMKHSYDCA